MSAGPHAHPRTDVRHASEGRQGLLAALRNPATYGLREPVEVRETHASWVFLVGPWAYKVKKPVTLAFLDYGTLERRHAACREELRVNRELGGDVYRRVVALVPTRAGLRLALDGTPEAVEYAIRMRRFDERRTLRATIEAGEDPGPTLPALARRLAAFHASTPSVQGGGSRALLGSWRENLEELGELVDVEAWRLPAMRRFAERFVAAHAATIDRRAREGLVRDGHGDLRCEHVLGGDPVTIVDRIEFDPDLRRLDVGCDLAFLLMDLEALGRPAAAEALLREYRLAGGDPGTQELVAFHAAHWALVRAKVALIAAAGQAGAARRRHEQQAQSLRALAERLCWRARGPIAVIVAGPPASGKSTLARALAARTGLEALASDVVRKRLAGLAPDERATPERYTPAFTRRTYRALGAAARETLRSGRGVILDATFASPAVRAELLDALDDACAATLALECRVSRATASRRASARMDDPRRVSDASQEIAAKLFDAFEPLAGAVPVDCEQPLADRLETVAAAADELLATAPAGP